MFVYLSKKIAIPNNNKVRALAWSRDHGFIACGGDDGLLKVLKLESMAAAAADGGDTTAGGAKSGAKGLAASKNLSMNQTLEGHSGTVENLCWNEPFQKLTSSDQNGLIIVWMLYKGSWFEEMVNNRNKSVVKGMSWTFDGLKICIVYEDGAVIVGSVDGNRLWGKELKGMKLSRVEWSPDARLILFGVLDTEVHIYDQNGNFLTKLTLQAIHGIYGRTAGYGTTTQIMGIEWFNGRPNSRDTTSLAIAFENGRIQLMRHENDDNPIVFDADIRISSICWNTNGSILSVTGCMDTETDNKRNYIKFYNQSGDLIQSMRVPGKEIYGSSWERESLRIALAVDSYIFFANIRPDYKWCYFASTVVYAMIINNTSGQQQQQQQQQQLQTDETVAAAGSTVDTVIFWHIPSETKYFKSVRNLLQIASHGQLCVIATRTEEMGGSPKTKETSSLIICNAIGTPVDMTTIELSVHYLSINSTRVIASSKDSFCLWKFKTPAANTNTPKGIAAQRMTYTQIGRTGDDLDLDDQTVKITFVSRNDPIVCISLSEKNLIVAQDSGTFQHYLLPNLNVVHKFNINCVATRMAFNRDSTKLSIIDKNGTLFIYDFEANTGNDLSGQLVEFEKHDVWDTKWSFDDTDVLAFTEKTKLCVYNMKTGESEEPFMSSGHICTFNDLTLRTVLLDELVNDCHQTDEPIMVISGHIVDYETKSLAEARQLLEKVELSEAIEYIEQQSHPRLWRLLCHTALDKLDLNVAEMAMIRCKDYKGIQFVKRVKQLTSDSLKRAEIYAYSGQFDEAERVYLDIDRKDLAIELRKTLGQYKRVVELLQSGFATADDNQLRDALCNLGDQFADNHCWDEAVVYYERSNAFDRLFECYCLLENYDGLRKLMTNFNDNHPILVEFGRVFESVGMCSEAVEAYRRGRKIDLAISCCVTMSEWKLAIDMAHDYDVPDIDPLLSKYAQHLLAKNKFFDIVELYKKANKIPEASTMLIKVISDYKKDDNKSDPILLKKLYTLVGLLHEESRKSTAKMPSSSSSAAINRNVSSLNALLNDESFSFENTNYMILDEPWKGAEAYHYLILCQRQLYEGYYDSAMKTALHLRDYEDFIDGKEIYCLLALTSCANKAFSICSKAFIKLESMDTIGDDHRIQYEELAINIFSKNPPKDSRTATKSECTYCETMIADWLTVCPSCHIKFAICVASGRPIMDASKQWTCNRCGHHAYKSDIITFNNCPLCHQIIDNKQSMR
ncbi:WD repeat-containing protein 35-like [Oppia nitens]|uniref:WD repeat-containing protein 35-like n=1 Tax=Oppia nitens TaxID=1686743 RepID=UPI0023DCDA55|nr:WD repeat-containing protein 35-like [Oppia nitens]